MPDPTPNVLLAVSGGIAAYKAADLCSKLAQSGQVVQVVMSDAATQFVGPATFAALSGRAVVTDAFDPSRPLGSHIELARGVELMIVAPATANIIAKLAGGLSDDLLSTLYLQVNAPVLIAPAMSNEMWSKPSVQRNVDLLKQDGCTLVGPESGWLSCRVQGTGRMSEPATIYKQVQETLTAGRS